MKEIIEIINAFDIAQREGRQTALVTLVHVEGSSYRRPGARMLVTDTGELTGAISGGCLEGDALNKALLAMHQQKNMLVTYDTTDEDDAVLGLGLGCNGVIQVLIQPVNNEDANGPLQLLKKVTASRRNNVLVTLFSFKNRKGEQPGTVIYMNDDETIYINHIDAEIRNIIQEDIIASFENQQSSFRNYTANNADITAYIEFIPPVVSVIILGAGNDAEPVAAMASLLGWQVTLIDDGRDKNTKKGRFAGTCQLMAVKPEDVLKTIGVDDKTFFLLMTHNYNYDMAMLRELLPKKVKYIGVLGPRKKMERMLGQLESEGLQFTQQQLAAVHNPVGLDIGAETPEEIALSMIAEIKTVMAGKEGNHLRNNNNVIHPRNATVIESKNSL
ncbi:MAG TPA: XdhC family protein [Flavitalea sp.]|nr:XdhC family protein [Flavitalea sp.]